MPHVRTDPISGGHVLVAPERAARPQAYDDGGDMRTDCPFCEGHEDQTPGEVYALRDRPAEAAASTAVDGPGWRIRVVPNKYPAVVPEEIAAAAKEGPAAPPLHCCSPARGAHEVVIESPAHVASLTEVTGNQAAEVFWAYRQRLAFWRRDGRSACGLLFKNAGQAAGASLPHLHSQLVTLPVVPPTLAAELRGARRYFDEHASCLFCDLVARERKDGARIVAETPRLVALCPFAARVPYETWIVPAAHAAHFDTIGRDLAAELASLVQQVLRTIESACPGCSYNYLVHTTPFDRGELEHYHWHIEILPRLARLAGFEWGSGMAINPLPPEDAAARLRALHC